jgi:uncharacterized protein YbjT (DUF2867 family)
MTTILLTGATGKSSTATIAALKGSGHKVIGLVRDAAKGKALKALGVEVRVGDLERPRSLETVFDGVDTAWLLAPPSPLAPYHTSNALWAAKQAGVRHVVRLSAVGAAHDAPTVNSRLHALSDSEVGASGIPYTILKPHFFLQNLLFSAGTIAEEGVMYWAFGEAKFPAIDVDDIGDATARILADPRPHAGKTYTLTGGEALTMYQIASAIGKAIGKPVKYVPLSVAAMVEGLAKMGVGDYVEVAYRDYMAAYSQGWQSQVTDAVKRITGKEPRTIADFARRYASAFSSNVAQ